MGNRSNDFYEFGPFHLRVADLFLTRQGEPVRLPPKDLETLLVLVQAEGQIVEKEELLNKVWPDTFVEEGNLARHISSLREVLGSCADGQAYIETIPRRGYRFVVPVRLVSDNATAAVVPEPQPAAVREVVPAPSVTPPRSGTHLGRLVVVPVAAVLLLVGYLERGRLWPRTAPSAQKVMLAVLPVQNLSGDPEQEYVSDGLTEEMIAQLGGLNPQQLGVIARTSSMVYKKTEKTVEQIGRELGVDYVVESSLRGTGDRIRVTAQLIRARDQTHLWARDYDHPLRDIVAVQDEVGRAIAQQI